MTLTDLQEFGECLFHQNIGKYFLVMVLFNGAEWRLVTAVCSNQLHLCCSLKISYGAFISMGKKFQLLANSLSSFPLISSPTIISNLLCVHQAAVCPGNAEDFVAVCEKRGTKEISLPTYDHLSRCQACQSFRSTLQSAVHRRSHNTAISSHTNYIHLTPDENMRMKNLHQSLRAAK